MPFPRFSRGIQVQQRQQKTPKIRISTYFCLSLQGACRGATAPLQLTVFVHSREWSPDEYLLSRGPTALPIATHQAATATAAPATPVPAVVKANGGGAGEAAEQTGQVSVGPWGVTVVNHGHLRVRGAPWDELKPHLTGSTRYAVVLQEQVII